MCVLCIMIMRLRRFKNGNRNRLLTFTFFRISTLRTFRLFRKTNGTTRRITSVRLCSFVYVMIAHVNCNCKDNRLTIHVRLLKTRHSIAMLRNNMTRTVTREVRQIITRVRMITTRLLRPFTFFREATNVLIIMYRERLTRVLQRDNNRLATKTGISRRCINGNIYDFAASRPCVRSNEGVFVLPDRRCKASKRRCRCCKFTHFRRYFRRITLYIQRFRFKATATLAARLKKLTRNNCGSVNLYNCFRNFIRRFLIVTAKRFATRRHNTYLMINVMRRITTLYVRGINLKTSEVLRAFRRNTMFIYYNYRAPDTQRINANINGQTGRNSVTFTLRKRRVILILRRCRYLYNGLTNSKAIFKDRRFFFNALRITMFVQVNGRSRLMFNF